MNVSDTLNTAADLIEEHGWTKGSGWPFADNFTGKFCAEGAIMGALGIADGIDRLWACPAYTFIRQYVGGQLFLWNDRPERTAEEVIATLRAAALVAAAREPAPVEVSA